MKYPEKTDGLPSIPRSLKNAGYSLEYYYGGDADFTNMRSYLVSSGIEKIISSRQIFLCPKLSRQMGSAGSYTFLQRFPKDLRGEREAAGTFSFGNRAGHQAVTSRLKFRSTD